MADFIFQKFKLNQQHTVFLFKNSYFMLRIVL